MKWVHIIFKSLFVYLCIIFLICSFLDFESYTIYFANLLVIYFLLPLALACIFFFQGLPKSRFLYLGKGLVLGGMISIVINIIDWIIISPRVLDPTAPSGIFNAMFMAVDFGFILMGAICYVISSKD